MLNHHLHRFTHSGLLHMQGNWDVNKQASLLTLALEGHFSTLKGLSKHKPDEWPQASLNGWTLWSWIEWGLPGSSADDGWSPWTGYLPHIVESGPIYNNTVLYSSYLFKKWNSGQILEEIYIVLNKVLHPCVDKIHMIMYFLTLCQQKCTKWHWPAAVLYNCSLLSGHCPRPGPASVPPGVASSPGWKYHIWSPERAGGTPPGRRAHGKHPKKHWENGYTFVNISAYSPARNIIQVCNILIPILQNY